MGVSVSRKEEGSFGDSQFSLSIKIIFITIVLRIV